MPYATTASLPKAVRDKIKDPKKLRQWMHVFNSMIAEGRSESAAMAGAWATVKKPAVNKAQYANDIFTTAEEARSRSMDMGLNGVIHVSDYEGQAVYLPAADEESYLDYYSQVAGLPTEDEMDALEGDGAESDSEAVDPRLEALRAIVQEVLAMGSVDKSFEGKILKVDDEQRMVYGWASVVTEKGVPVVDRQGDVIEADTLVKAVNNFMEYVRVGKAMHTGEQVGVVVHSLPVTKEICDALGIQSDREGWVVAYKVYDDKVWEMVKSGELAAFSIGGRANKEEI